MIAEEVLSQLSLIRKEFAAEQTAELYVLDLSLLYFFMVTLNVTCHLTKILPNEDGVSTQLASHFPIYQKINTVE